MATVRIQRWLAVVVALLSALAFGALLGSEPQIAVGLVGVGLITALGLLAPVANLVTLLFLTGILPYALQNRFGIGGGASAPGLLLSDCLILAGLLQATLFLAREPLDRRRRLVIAATVVFVAIALVQLGHGILAGSEVSKAGAEFRPLLGFATVLMTLPILDDPIARSRLVRSLLGLGIVVGLWGIVQWVVEIPFVGGDVGVREGVSYTTAGRGQVQGGLFAFPIAILLGTAALIFDAVRSMAGRTALITLVGLNSISLILTYERTLWLATLLGVLALVVRAKGEERARAMTLIPVLALLGVTAMTALAPAALSAAGQRLLSLGQFQSDPSVRYRFDETRHVVAQIQARPFTGSGLGATIRWGRPYERVPPATYTYSHNGYLWLSWKIGIPGACVLVLLLAVAALSPTVRLADPMLNSLRAGSQAAALAILVINAAFPIFNTLAISATIGVLLAVVATRHAGTAARRPGHSDATSSWRLEPWWPAAGGRPAVGEGAPRPRG